MKISFYREKSSPSYVLFELFGNKLFSVYYKNIILYSNTFLNFKTFNARNFCVSKLKEIENYSL